MKSVYMIDNIINYLLETIRNF